MAQVERLQQVAGASQGLTVANLTVWIHDDAAEASTQEHSRLSRLAGMFKGTATADAGSVFKDYLADRKTALGDKTPAYKSEQNRVAEMKALFGAWKYTGLDFTKLGYHNAVKAAQASLKVKGIKWTGEPKLTSEQKAEQLATKEAKQVAEAAITEAIRANGGDSSILRDSEVMAEHFEKASEAQRHEKAKLLCIKVIQTYGLEYAELIAEHLAEVCQDYSAGLDANVME